MTERTQSSYRVTFDYSFRSPYGIPLPLLRGIKLKSRMSISLSISKRNSETMIDKKQGNGLEPQSSSSEFAVSPRANYSFSSRVKGGLTAQWTDSQDNTGGALRKSHIRELGIWAEFSF